MSTTPSVLLQRLLHLSPIKAKPKARVNDGQPKWVAPFGTPEMLPSLRLLVFRECDGKPRKLYFDSDTVRRESQNSLCSGLDKAVRYDLVCEGFAYKMNPANLVSCLLIERAQRKEYTYEKSKHDVKHIGEMVFGSIPPSGDSVGFKIHFLKCPDQQMWSTTFGIDQRAHGNSSIGSSFGSNLSSASLDMNEVSFPFLMDLDRRSSEQDSGIYSVSSGPHSEHHHTAGMDRTSTKMESDASLHKGTDALLTKLDSTSSCDSFHQRWRCSLDFEQKLLLSPFKAVINPPSSGDPSTETSSNTLPSVLHMNRASGTNLSLGQLVPRSTDHLSVTSGALRKKSSTVLGLAIIIDTPNEVAEILSANAAFMEDVHNKLRVSCVEAYQDRYRFIHLVYEAWKEAQQDMEDLFLTPRLEKTSWQNLHTSDNGESSSTKIFLTQEILFFIKKFDTKETHFFFSTFLTALLTYSTGWVRSVADTDPVEEENNLRNIERHFFYDVHEAQAMDLYGMTGYPCRATKSLLFGEDREILKRFVYVISYFVRSSVALRQTFESQHVDPSNIEYSEKPVSEFGDQLPIEENPQVMTTRSSRDRICVATSGLKKSTTAQRLILDDEDEHDAAKAYSSIVVDKAEDVIFVVGETEEHLPARDASSKTLTSLDEDVDNPCQSRQVLSKPSKLTMESEPDAKAIEAHGRVDVYVPLHKVAVTSMSVEDLPTLICQSYMRIVPGAVIQGCLLPVECDYELEKTYLTDKVIPKDLRWSSENSFFIQKVEEFLCISGDMRNGEVRLHSSKKGQISNSSSLPLFSAPLIVSMIDAVSFMSFGDPDLILMIIEDKLREIYRKSQLLSEYLMSVGVTKMDEVVAVLKMEANDIPLLLSVASTHSPEVASRYGVSLK